MPTSRDRPQLFVEYMGALSELIEVPGALDAQLATASAEYDRALASADASFRSEQQRIARLRATLTKRYSESITSLQAADVPMPPSVRASSLQRGDAASLSSAISAQQEAVDAVARELSAAELTKTAEEHARVSAGRDAAEALRRRQENVRRTRALAEAERGNVAAERPELPRALVGVAIGGAFLILVALALVLL